MDAASAQVLAEQLGLDTAETEALASGGPAALIAERLAAETSDPVVQLLLNSAIARGQEAVAPADDETLVAEQLRQAKQTIRALRRHLADADAMIAHVAESFGACPVCWGGSELCQRCHGRDGPGTLLPDEERLYAWVVPALDRLGLRVATKDVPGVGQTDGDPKPAPQGKGAIQ